MRLHQTRFIFPRVRRLLLSAAVVAGFFPALGSRAIAQREFCPDPGPIPAAEDTRSLELPQFGLNLTIPANYRAILRNSGAVEIVNPGTYQVLHCVAQGGRALGRGYTSTIVRSMPLPDKASLREFVQQNTKLSGSITPYNWQDNRGYLVRSRFDRTAQFWVKPETVPGVVVISYGCDCRGMADRLVNLLEDASLLE